MPELQSFEEFYKLMIDFQKLRVNKAFVSGSQAEVEDNDKSIVEFCGKNTMDVDYMMYSRDAYVFEDYNLVPSNYRGLILRYVTDGIHPGYARLLKCDESELVFADIEYNLSVDSDSIEYQQEYLAERKTGPSVKNNINSSIGVQFYPFNELKEINAFESDHVVARHSPYWPREAVEWIARQRLHGSLSRDIIRRVVGHGLDFVCVSHKGYVGRENFHEWRLSFSMAELILIKNWSRQQRAVYRTLRVLHKRSLNNVQKPMLCTYHFKTLMLWAVDTKPKYFWEDHMLLYSAFELIMDMILCLNIKCLPHYFVPTNNLFDCLRSGDFSDDMNSLTVISSNTDLVNNVLISCLNEETWTTTENLFVSMPALFYDSIEIATSMRNEEVRAAELVDSFKPGQDVIQKKIALELKAVYALAEFFMTVNNSKGAIYSINALALNNCSSADMDRPTDRPTQSDMNFYGIFNCSKELHKTIHNFYRLIGTQEGNYKDIRPWLHSSVQCKDLVENEVSSNMFTVFTQIIKVVSYCRCESFITLTYTDDTSVIKDTNSKKRSENCNKIKNSQSLDTLKIENNPSLDTLKIENNQSLDTLSLIVRGSTDTMFNDYEKYYKYWRKHSPTASIFWIIKKVYTANHYYTLFSDLETTVEICDKIILACTVSMGNKRFAELYVPVLLTSQWIEMYDRELQQMLGLTALCRFIIHGSDNRPVNLPVCPIQFALYLKARCCLETDLIYAREEAYHELLKHGLHLCADISYFGYGSASLLGALRITELNKDPNSSFKVKIIKHYERVTGVTVLDDEIFVVRMMQWRVNVYDSHSLTASRDINVPGMRSPEDLAGCSYNRALYLSDSGKITIDRRQNTIHRVDLTTNSFTSWRLRENHRPHGLSVTATHTLLVTVSIIQGERKECSTKNKYKYLVEEYTSQGQLLREIRLDSSLKWAWQTIQLSFGQFIVTHGGFSRDLSRVCLVNTEGQIIQSYSGEDGGEDKQLWLRSLAIDDDSRHIFVADVHNKRILLLDNGLNLLGYIQTPRYQWPLDSLYFHSSTKQLFVGEGNRLSIINNPDVAGRVMK